MRVVIADENQAIRVSFAKKLAQDPRVLVHGVYSNLSSTYHAVEHHPPRVAIIGSSLASKLEFEVMLLLFRVLSVTCFVIEDEHGDAEPCSQSELGRNCPVLDPNAQIEEIVDAILARRSTSNKNRRRRLAGSVSMSRSQSKRIFLIGASTGGVDALLEVLGRFPEDCPPTLIVQHTRGRFTQGLARLLNSRVPPNVETATDGGSIEPGQVLLAPGDTMHLGLDPDNRTRCRLLSGDKVNGHRPSVDTLFRSGIPHARHITACILTGMGRDGAAGLKSLNEAGAYAIGQDKDTSLVYGMPRVAKEIGAVSQQFPLEAISGAMLNSLEGSLV